MSKITRKQLCILKKPTIIVSFIVWILYSCSAKQDENFSCNVDVYELLIAKESRRTELLWDNISNISTAYILISGNFSDTVKVLKESRNVFQNLLFKLQNNSKTVDNQDLIDFENQYFILLDYLSFYENQTTLSNSIEEIKEALHKTSNPDLKRLIVNQLYNEVLMQKLIVMRFKYDSLLFECHDSINNQNPYSNSFITTETISTEYYE